MFKDAALQRMFEGKFLKINDIERECYYCTYEDGGAWIWLRPTKDDNCNKINFIVSDEYYLEEIYKSILLNQNIPIERCGRLSFQN